MGTAVEFTGIIIIVAVIVGLIECFFGYRIFKFIIGFTGFVFGGVLAGMAGYAVSEEALVALIAGLVGGIIGAAMMLLFYYIGIFLTGALIGGLMGTVLSTAFYDSPEPIVIILLALLAGILALVLQKLMIILSTSFTGSFIAVGGIGMLVMGMTEFYEIDSLLRSGTEAGFAVMIGSVILGIAGVIVQYRTIPAEEGDD